MLISSEALLVVATTARCKSFAAAAERLHKVPTAIGYTVHKLEDMLGVKLFERDGKQLHLTEAGKFFLAKSENILNDLENLQRASMRMSSGVEAELRLSLNNIVSTAPLLPLIKQSEILFPQTEIHCAIDVHGGVWDALFDGRADLAIGAPSQMKSGGGVRSELMGTVEWDFLVSPAHPLAAIERPLRSSDLRAYPAICIEDTSIKFEPEVAWRLKGQKAVIAPDFLTKIQMQIAGLGIGFIPRHFGTPYLRRGLLCKKQVKESKQPTPLFFAWSSTAQGSCLRWWLEQLAREEIKSDWCAHGLGLIAPDD